ncbi:hypothetical protein LT330_009745 [Penicillium expansum]|uniref:C2 NT-type domain-containing protein n=1 Tax=Penicillium expansum TaxID=27334 RepID=A0A0A2KPI9_PENEN|nr:hypothetical protein PEX2_036120 [Penicillium expansum]KAK4864482.1 hypothetical protein LT330_009745 [Penicillium expansum]KGO44279.1 hypothetical protein PEXP_057720 [Penicillium expansum]KGO60105.1 hypothetical protein PEX2_036120 [Penicillium expansum]KGO68893.1 hypothetical protein PEX1_025880 [Penicillium expansum]
MQAFVPKNRRPRFELVLRIIDINNVPLGNSVAFVRWRLPSSSSAEHQGHTEKAILSDHRAYWGYEKCLQVRLTIDRTSILQECELNFEVIQEYTSSPMSEKGVLGKIKLNLAEYVDKSDEDEGIIRRYLMHESKVNSTVKIGIAMRQLEGDRNFTTPHLKSATVFGGIAGVVQSSEMPVNADEFGHLPSIDTKSREIADMQDMYRRTLAASWSSRACDLPADQLVEELFAGSSGWNNDAHNANAGISAGDHRDALLSAETAPRQSRSGKKLSPSFERRPKSTSSNRSHNSSKTPDSLVALGHQKKSGSIEQQLYEGVKGRVWKAPDANNELSEFDVREDLRSWEIVPKE